LSQPQIELSYDHAKLPWHRRQRVQQWLILAAILIAAVWVINASRPIWPRLRYYHLQQQAATYLIGPSRVLVRHSATQPYNHIPGPADQFFAAFEMAANQARLPQAGWGGAVLSTPIFCGLRTTKGGSPQIVRIYSGVLSGNGGSLPDLFIDVIINKWRTTSWVFKGTSGPTGDPAALGLGIIVAPIMRPATSVLVLGGSANPQDSSEVDIQVIFNGQPTTIQFHVTEYPIPCDRSAELAGVTDWRRRGSSSFGTGV